MRKPTQDLILDIISFISFSFLVSTGLLMKFFMGHGTVIWGMGHHMWSELHFWISVVFIATIFVHLVSHWKWIFTMVKGRVERYTRTRSGVAIALLMLVLGVAAAPFFDLSQENVAGSEQEHMEQDGRGARNRHQDRGDREH